MSYSAPHAHLKWQVPPGASAPDLSCEESLPEPSREACPSVGATFDALDDAGNSRNGDEFDGVRSPGTLREWAEAHEASVAIKLADARCARCSEGDDFALLISGMDEAMIAYADRTLGDDQVWSRLKAIRQAMSEAL